MGSRTPRAARADHVSRRNTADKPRPPKGMAYSLPRLTEEDVTKQVTGWLDTQHDIRWERMNSRVVMLPGKGGTERPVRFGEKGCGDLRLTMRVPVADFVVGLAMSLELKRPGEEPEPHQWEWGEEWQKRGGGLYRWADSLEMAQAAVRDLRELAERIAGACESCRNYVGKCGVCHRQRPAWAMAAVREARGEASPVLAGGWL